MTTASPDWEQRIAALWAAIEVHQPGDFRAQMTRLADELPIGHPLALFEVASANDSTGEPGAAAPLYRQALRAGLTGYRRRRAVIQLAGTLRNLGRADESVALLTAERELDPASLDEATAGLGDAVDAFLALALADSGREREAVALALNALSRHLPRYNRSLACYAEALCDDPGR
ncbi:tetratricopeptide repeat protein [Streptomyces luteireticuli]|uniref:Tetratricopeptide repeat protein n=1 Tax=Streptomyces luteireticuli TaxID=173858 RepID=A0ABN0YJ14_9ACTN